MTAIPRGWVRKADVDALGVLLRTRLEAIMGAISDRVAARLSGGG